MSDSPRRVVIDGNIASGKSTQFDMLAKQGYSVLSERIYDWPLELFYSDPKRWALLLQFAILKSFHTHKNDFKIFERSPESSRDVFWKMFLAIVTLVMIGAWNNVFYLHAENSW